MSRRARTWRLARGENGGCSGCALHHAVQDYGRDNPPLRKAWGPPAGTGRSTPGEITSVQGDDEGVVGNAAVAGADFDEVHAGGAIDFEIEAEALDALFHLEVEAVNIAVGF